MAQFCIKCYIYPPNSSDQYAFPAYINVGGSKAVPPPEIKSTISPNDPTPQSLLFCLPKVEENNQNFAIPYFCVPGFRKQHDIDGKECCIFCFLFNEETITTQIKVRPRIYQLIIQTAIEAMSTEFGVSVSTAPSHPISVPKDFIWYTSRPEILKILKDIEDAKDAQPILNITKNIKTSKSLKSKSSNRIKPKPFSIPPSWKDDLLPFYNQNTPQNQHQESKDSMDTVSGDSNNENQTQSLSFPWWWTRDPPEYIIEEKFLPISSSMVDSYHIDPLSSRSVATTLNSFSSLKRKSKKSHNTHHSNNECSHNHDSHTQNQNQPEEDQEEKIYIDADGKTSSAPAEDGASFLVKKQKKQSDTQESVMTAKSSRDLFCHFGAVPISSLQNSQEYSMDPKKAHWPDKMVLNIYLPELVSLSLNDDNFVSPFDWISKNTQTCLVAGRHFWFNTKEPNVDMDLDISENPFYGYQPLSIELPYPVPYDPFTRFRKGENTNTSNSHSVSHSDSISTTEDMVDVKPVDTEVEGVPMLHPQSGTCFSFYWNDSQGALICEFFVDKFIHNHCHHQH